MICHSLGRRQIDVDVASNVVDGFVGESDWGTCCKNHDFQKIPDNDSEQQVYEALCKKAYLYTFIFGILARQVEQQTGGRASEPQMDQ